MNKQLIFSLPFLFLITFSSIGFSKTMPDAPNKKSVQSMMEPNSTWIEGFYIRTIEIGDTEIIICREMKDWICLIILVFPTETNIVVDPDGEHIEYNNISNYSIGTDANGNTSVTITP